MAVCRLGVVACILVSLWGCGYRPLGAAPPDPQVRPTLAIPLFANRSTEVGLEAIFATAMINAFAQTGAVKVVPGDRDADLVLEGKVRSLDNTSVAFDSITQSSVRRVSLRVEVTLRQKKGDKVLLKDTQYPPGRLRGGPQLPHRGGHQNRRDSSGGGHPGPAGAGQGAAGALAVSGKQLSSESALTARKLKINRIIDLRWACSSFG